VRLVIPVKGALGVGGDFSEFLRNSDFTISSTATTAEKVEHVRQHNPQVRVYLALTSR